MSTMKKIILPIFLTLFTCGVLAAQTDRPTREARKYARKLSKAGWRSLGDDDLIPQIDSCWSLMYLVNDEGYSVYYSYDIVSEDENIARAVVKAIESARVRALDNLVSCTIVSEDWLDKLVLPEAPYHYIIYKEDSNHELIPDLNQELITIEEGRTGYEQLIPILKEHEQIPLCMWRRNGHMYEVRIWYLFPFEVFYPSQLSEQ